MLIEILSDVEFTYLLLTLTVHSPTPIIAPNRPYISLDYPWSFPRTRLRRDKAA